MHRIVLIEAPAALGWERWREIGQQYGVGLVEAAIQTLLDAGLLADQPVRPLAHVLIGALEEAALYAARAEDPRPPPPRSGWRCRAGRRARPLTCRAWRSRP